MSDALSYDVRICGSLMYRIGRYTAIVFAIGAVAGAAATWWAMR